MLCCYIVFVLSICSDFSSYGFVLKVMFGNKRSLKLFVKYMERKEIKKNIDSKGCEWNQLVRVMMPYMMRQKVCPVWNKIYSYSLLYEPRNVTMHGCCIIFIYVVFPLFISDTTDAIGKWYIFIAYLSPHDDYSIHSYDYEYYCRLRTISR